MTSLRHVLPLAAVLLASAPAMAAGVAPGEATPAQRDKATSHFVKGKVLFGKSKFEAALGEFNASLDVVASPNTRLYIARCHRELGHATIAYAELTRTAAEAKQLAKKDARYDKTAQAALEERKELDAKVGFVDLAVTHTAPNTVVKVGGEVVQRDRWSEPVPVMPGAVEVVVESEGRAPVVRSVQVAAGEHKPAQIDADDGPPPAAQVETPAPAHEPLPLRTLSYVAGGVGVAGLATFTILGLMSNSTYSELEAACGSGPCPDDKMDDVSKGKRQQTIANVGLVVGVIGVAAGVTLFVLSNKPSTAAAPAAMARVVAGPSFVRLEGAF